MNIKSLYMDRGFWKTALRLTIPIALQNLLSASFSLVDTFMVAKLGGDVLASVGMAGQWSWLLNIFCFGIVSAASLFISQYWGIQDIKAIHRTSGLASVSALAVSAVFLAGGAALPGGILSIFSRTPEIVSCGSIYLRTVCYSYPAFALNLVLCAVLRSTEKVKLPMAVSLCTAVLNAVLNYCFIFGKLGFPYMGVQGAALATCISTWTGTLLIFAVSFWQKNILIAPLKELFGFTRRNVGEFYRRATPVIINEAIWGLGTVLINIIFSNMGDDYYTGITILRTFENLSYVLVIGLCSACSVMVGKSIGGGKLQRAKEDACRFAAIMPIVCIVTGALTVIFRHQLVGIFTSGSTYSEAAIAAALSCLLIYGCDMPMRNMPYLMIVGVFRPGGNTKLGMICDLSSLWLLAIPLTAVLAFVVKLPFTYVFLAMYLIEDIPKTALCLAYFASGKWIRPVTDEGKRALSSLEAEKKSRK